MDPSRYSLLIVDDEEMNRDMLSRRLQRLGFRVLTAASGPEALGIIENDKLDLVLLDIMMPGMDGLEVLATVRAAHSLVELPVIMVTARDQGGDVVAALQIGANDYVAKPVNFPVVFARIQTQLSVKETNAAALAQQAQNDTRSGPITWTDTGPGKCIGDYEILHELGRGGMGVVYKARHGRMNRLVALKMIDREHLARPDSVERFYREIQAAAQLNHPNIVVAYDAGQCGAGHYFAMEFVEGTDLARLVEENGPLPVVDACDYTRQVALGLQHAYEKGLVHRDIKPSNLLLCTSVTKPVVKILDLGLAMMRQPATPTTPAKELTRNEAVVGSVDYMAPEQWMNPSTVDVRADLYSLGCTLYYLLAGGPPFHGAEPMEKMLKHHLDEPEALHQRCPGVPDKVSSLVKRMMAKKPEQRYQTPSEVAELLGWYVHELRNR